MIRDMNPNGNGLSTLSLDGSSNGVMAFPSTPKSRA